MPSSLKCHSRRSPSRRRVVVLGLAALGLSGSALLTPGSALGAPAAGVPRSGVGQSADPALGNPAAQAALASGERQADLVAGEDQRLTDALVAGRPDPHHLAQGTSPYRVRSSGYDTLVLTARRTPYSFDDLRKLAPETLVPQRGGVFLLREHVLVAPGATLSISPRRPLTIKMSSGPEGFVSLVTAGGRLRLNGTAAAPITFESWDESHGRVDTDVTDGRAYIRASGQLVVRHAHFAALGFWSGRTGGLSVVGSASMIETDATAAGTATAAATTKKSSHGTVVLPAGKLPASSQADNASYSTQISDATMTGNAFGLFLTGISGPKITRTVIQKSLVDGLVLHRDVDSAQIDAVQVTSSGTDGVVVARQVEGTVLTRLTVRGNGRDGIVLAGRPLAEGPSASGSSTRAFGNNVLTASQVSGNAVIGVHVVGGTAVRVQGNSVTGGRAGIVVSDGASGIDVDSNRVVGASANGIQVRESTAVAVTANVIRDSPTGIHIRNSSSSIRENSTTGVTLHGITFVGLVAGSVADHNALSGSGTSAIDVVRVVGHSQPTVRGNDLSGWSRTVTKDSLVSVLLHPLTVIWMAVAVILIVMSRPRRRGTGLPYRIDPLARRLGVGDAVLAVESHAVDPHAGETQAVPRGPVITIPDQYSPRHAPDHDPVRHRPVPAARVEHVPVEYPPVEHVPVEHVPVEYPPVEYPAQFDPAEYEPVPVGRVKHQPVESVLSVQSVQSVLLGQPPAAVPPQHRPATRERPGVEPAPEGLRGGAVIDLAIRESRMDQGTPRRRRVSSR